MILALGLPEMFESLDHGETLDIGVMVAGYVVMRLGMVSLWIRAAQQDVARRRTALTYIQTIVLAQVIWTALVFAELPIGTTFAIMAVALLIEVAGPFIAERIKGPGTPWNPHHIAERYGLLVIITLGEGVIGTVAALSAVVHNPEAGWNVDAVLLLGAGIGLTFGLWWMYFAIPFGEILAARRERGFLWGTAICRSTVRSPRWAPGCTSPLTSSNTTRSSARSKRCSAP